MYIWNYRHRFCFFTAFPYQLHNTFSILPAIFLFVTTSAGAWEWWVCQWHILYCCVFSYLRTLVSLLWSNSCTRTNIMIRFCFEWFLHFSFISLFFFLLFLLLLLPSSNPPPSLLYPPSLRKVCWYINDLCNNFYSPPPPPPSSPTLLLLRLHPFLHLLLHRHLQHPRHQCPRLW